MSANPPVQHVPPGLYNFSEKHQSRRRFRETVGDISRVQGVPMLLEEDPCERRGLKAGQDRLGIIGIRFLGHTPPRLLLLWKLRTRQSSIMRRRRRTIVNL